MLSPPIQRHSQQQHLTLPSHSIPLSILLSFLLSACTPKEIPTEIKQQPPLVALSPKQQKNLHRLFLLEMYEQIYNRKLKDPKSYISWINVLNQGASLEGVYRGLIQSTHYVDMENNRNITSTKALDFFATEVNMLENNKTFDRIPFLKKSLRKHSLFTLKRFLGDKLLDKIALLKNKELNEWFADTATRWSHLGISFGHKKRNSTNRGFHYNWAKNHDRSRIQWEILQRMHRVMNHYGKTSNGTQ